MYIQKVSASDRGRIWILPRWFIISTGHGKDSSDEETRLPRQVTSVCTGCIHGLIDNGHSNCERGREEGNTGAALRTRSRTPLTLSTTSTAACFPVLSTGQETNFPWDKNSLSCRLSPSTWRSTRGIHLSSSCQKGCTVAVSSDQITPRLPTE